MTKSEQIRDLYAKGCTVKEIASVVGCREEYVRVCARQRKDGKPSNADLKYMPVAQAAYQKGDRKTARKASAKAYRKAKAEGFTTQVAINRGGSAYRNAMIRTGRQSSA